MAKENVEQKIPETTESYRGKIRNVDRIVSPANDNKRRNAVTNGKLKQSTTASGRLTSNNKRQTDTRLGSLREQGGTIQKGVAVTRATSASWTIVAASSILYPVQLCVGAVSLAGLSVLVAVEGTWAGWLDAFGWFSSVGEELFFIAMGINLVIGVLTLMFAFLVFSLRGVSINRGISLIVAAICFSMYAAPVLNLLPWIWLWCLYVVKSQADG